jgi:hypothetical protein
MRWTTIYGRCGFDLVSADGPMPIAFSLAPAVALFSGDMGALNGMRRTPSPAKSPIASSSLTSGAEVSALQMLFVPRSWFGGDGNDVVG